MRAMGRTAAFTVAAALLLLAACASGREPATADTAATTPHSEQSSPPRDLALVPIAAARGVTICIDVGHGLQEPNITVPVTVGSGPTTRTVMLTEVEINLDVATRVAALLRERYRTADPPVTIVMTWGEIDGLDRPWDPLIGPESDAEVVVQSRGAFCVAQRADVVVSMHTNAGSRLNGTLTGYRDDNDRELAAVVHPMILEQLGADPSGTPLDGFVSFGLDPGDWWISEGAAAPDLPVVILEPVMMTIADEARRLLPTIEEQPAGRRAQIANIEAKAIAAYVDAYLLAPPGGEVAETAPDRRLSGG